MGKKQFIYFVILVVFVFGHSLLAAAAAPLAMKEIRDASDAVRESMSHHPKYVQDQEIARLEAALKRGEEINAALQKQLDDYRQERAELVKVQTTLTSGLIGALVTTAVAIGGAIVSARNSRPERDLKRLAAIEKVRELQELGVQLPRDLRSEYAASLNSNLRGKPSQEES